MASLKEHGPDAAMNATPEAGDEIPSASKCRETTGDTLTPGDEIPAFASRAPAVTADVTEGPEGGAVPDRPVEDPLPVGQNKPEDNQKIPRFLRRYGIGAAHAQPIASDREPSEGRQVDQPSGFMPSIVLRDRRDGRVISPVTPPQAAPVAASVTPAVTVPVAGSICPTCGCRVPARLSAAERQRAYRKRQQEHGQGPAIGN